jgi:uncharacterized protein (DUF433 family)
MITRNFGYLWRQHGISGGAPCLDGTGILVSFVASRFAAGETVAELARDYAVHPEHIEAAIRFVVYVKGASLDSKRAEAKIAASLPLLHRRGCCAGAEAARG